MNEKLLITLKVDELKDIIHESISSAISKIPQRTEEVTLLKRKAVAKIFDVSLVTLNKWMKEGRIQYHRINSRIFFKEAEVLEALNSVKKYGRI